MISSIFPRFHAHKPLFNTLAVFLIIVLLPKPSSIVEAKTSSGAALLTGQNSEYLLTKFALFPQSLAKFDLRLSIPSSVGMYTDERFLRVHFFVDEAWNKKARVAPTCQDKVKYAIKALPVTFTLKKRSDDMEWTAEVQTMLDSSKSDKTQYWYISLDDCSLEQSYHSIKDAPEMFFQYTIQNNDSRNQLSHFSADESGMGGLHVVEILFSSLLLFWCAYKIVYGLTSSRGQIHIALVVVACAVACDVCSNISELIHTIVYSKNGIGSYAFDAFAAHFEAQCDAMIAVVLLLVGSGWTLPSDVVVTDSKNDMSMLGTNSMVQKLVLGLRNPASALQQIRNGNPAGILVAFVLSSHAILAQWGRTYDEEFDCYHSLEHLPGTVLMVLRMTLGLAFLIGVASIRNSGRCPRALYPFLTKFMLVGISWFISLPSVSMFVSTFIVHHLKHWALSVGSALTQSSSLASLVWLFTADSDASAYHRLSKIKEGNMSLGSTAGSNTLNMWNIGKAKIRLD